MSGRIRELNDKLVSKVAIAEFSNRLARSAVMTSASAEYRPSRDPEAAEAAEMVEP